MNTQASTGNAIVEDQFPMLVVGRDHRVSFANHKAYALLGYEHGSLSGMSIEQVLAPSRRKEVRNIQAVLRGQSVLRWQSAARHADGSELEVGFAVEPCLDDRGQVVAVTLRCERLLRTRRSMPPALDMSGMRKIPYLVPALPSSPPPAPTSTSPARPSMPPARQSVPPAPPSVRKVASELVLAEDGAEQLETALQLLCWLRQHLQTTAAGGGDARDQARALTVLGEATELVAQVRCESKREPKAAAKTGIRPPA